MDKWTYEIEEGREIWRGGLFETREEAIKEANSEAILDGKDTFRIGIVEEATNHGVDVDFVIEDIQNSVYEEIGEVAEDYLDDVTKEHREELEEALNKVFYEWQEKYNYKPTFYKVISEEIIDVTK